MGKIKDIILLLESNYLKMVIEQNQIGTTIFDKESEILIEIYSGRVNIELILNHFEKIEQFSELNNIKGSIVDIRRLYGSFVKLLGGIERDYYPKLIKSGLKHQAFVISDDLIIKNLASKAKGIASKFNIQVRTFYSKEEAEKWIDTIL